MRIKPITELAQFTSKLATYWEGMNRCQNKVWCVISRKSYAFPLSTMNSRSSKACSMLHRPPCRLNVWYQHQHSATGTRHLGYWHKTSTRTLSSSSHRSPCAASYLEKATIKKISTVAALLTMLLVTWKVLKRELSPAYRATCHIVSMNTMLSDLSLPCSRPMWLTVQDCKTC